MLGEESISSTMVVKTLYMDFTILAGVNNIKKIFLPLNIQLDLIWWWKLPSIIMCSRCLLLIGTK